MKRSVLVGLTAAVTAAAIASVLSRPYLWPSREMKHAHVMEPARAEPGAAIYYQDPDGKPFYSLTPKKTSDGRDYRAVPSGADVSFDDPAEVATILLRLTDDDPADPGPEFQQQVNALVVGQPAECEEHGSR